MATVKDNELVTKEYLKGELEKFDKKIENRFEKQEVMLEQRLKQYRDDIVSEVKRYNDVLVENVRDEVGGACKDELLLTKEKVEDHEERITTLEKVR